MIIFNEKRFVEENILRPNGKIKNTNELLMFIRYCNELGYSYGRILEIAMSKVDQTNAVVLIVENEHLYKNAYNRAIKRKQYANEPVAVGEKEFNWVRSVDDVECEKILFTLLVIQKFLKLEFIKIDYKDIKNHALTKKQSGAIREIIDELQARGYVCRITDKTYKVLVPYFENDNPYLTITDYNHIPAPYLHKLKTKEFFYCEWCGRKTKYTENDANSNYCRVFCEKCAGEPHKSRKKS